MTIEELSIQIDRLNGAQECRNLMGKYSYYHTAFRNKEYVQLWANREDTYFKFPFGEYKGIEAIKECYLVGHGDITDPGMDVSLKGMLMMHQMDTEVLVVADDAQTAKGCWISPGHETMLRNPPGVEGPVDKSKGVKDLIPDPQWCWGKYEVEFIRENGEWKIWHMVLFPLFKTSFYKAWTECEEIDEPQFNDGELVIKSKPDFWQWSKDAVYPADEPEPPLPYHSYEDMPHKILPKK